PFKGVATENRQDIKLAILNLDHALGFPCDNMATLGHFIFTGILERFPKLRLGILESNAGWLPFWLGRMDDHTHGRNAALAEPENISMLPSESFMRQRMLSCGRDATWLQDTVEPYQG